MRIFDPWTWTFEEVHTDSNRLWAEAMDRGECTSKTAVNQIKQWIAAQDIKDRQVLIAEGDSFILFQSVNLCLAAGLSAPEWLSKAFENGFRMVENSKAGSWDGAYGKPFPINTQVEKEEQDKRLAWKIYYLVEKLRAGRTRWVSPFRRTEYSSVYDYIGKELLGSEAIDKKRVASLYTAVKEWIKSHDAHCKKRMNEE